jgi:hypothetical protein
MSSLSLVIALSGGLIITGITFDMILNGAQDWYATLYEDATWSYRVKDSPALRDLEREEAGIDRILQRENLEQEKPHR